MSILFIIHICFGALAQNRNTYSDFSLPTYLLQLFTNIARWLVLSSSHVHLIFTWALS